MSLTAEQVLEKTQQNGSFDKLRKELFEAFISSERCKAFEKNVNVLLQTISEDPEMRWTKDKAKFLERQLLEHFERNRELERIDKDARNFWLVPERRNRLNNCITQGIEELCDSGTSTEDRIKRRKVVTRSLELDPPRLPPRGSRGASRGHNYYRRGDSVAAFLATTDALCQTSQYICLLMEVSACDALKGSYTVEDLDKTGTDEQHTWVVYWDQILAIKRPYEQVYRPGDQVYALFRDDYGGDAAVSTEFFPGRVEQVSQMVLAIQFDTGEICHVYYDEVFAAGRVGFMRQMSDERRKLNKADAMVEVNGRFLPSFTGFWPETAQPALGKHGHKVRYREPPHLLIEHKPRTAVHKWEQSTTRAITPSARESRSAVYHETVDANGSDMELDSTGESPLASSRGTIYKKPADLKPITIPQVPSETVGSALSARLSSTSIQEYTSSRRVSQTDLQRTNDVETVQSQRTAERKSTTETVPVSTSSEDGEIEAGEEGEVHDPSLPAVTPMESTKSRDMSPSMRRPSMSRSSVRYGERESRWDRRTPPYRERRRSYSRRSGYPRDDSRTRDRSTSVRRHNSRYHLSGYPDDYRSRINTHSRSRSPARPMIREMGPSSHVTSHVATSLQPTPFGAQSSTESGPWSPSYGRYTSPRRTPPLHGTTHYRDYR
ncbi:hypothetical protein COEREDRAFT_82120 [Coemansia reversa NRRL 1564]|uniref:SGF29 C-terminal domain-containing protein n=1 Tax=Coemansia reversa (strain ATCC 12441 / NRRL 1564) TaxID=763665 RepID=A0A2G5B8L3_COERN|nr:hypothetical protein COEREDRAFT_82120 [Coemansia reversa NRRL 1564]|eukprot:PIA15373.1 hypothetical protein COEREDRAFT_82120 [Coemansia reversa NRRL 1564]